MTTAQILTPWTGDGRTLETAFRPQLMDDFKIDQYTDLTGQPNAQLIPSPNLLLVQVQVSPAVLAQIEANPTYLVVSSE